MPTAIKICGLSDPEGVDAALRAGADYVGFVFFAKSPRNLPLVRAAELAERARGRAGVVALTVDAGDRTLAEIAAVLRPDLIQLHGSEDPARVAAVRRDLGRPVMKAVGIASAADLPGLTDLAADVLLLDAKAPPDSARPGGNGASFEWAILQRFSPPVPWFLAGGLDPENVASAVEVTRPAGVDVSSGVESAPGKKDPERIRAFVAAVRAADQAPSGAARLREEVTT